MNWNRERERKILRDELKCNQPLGIEASLLANHYFELPLGPSGHPCWESQHYRLSVTGPDTETPVDAVTHVRGSGIKTLERPFEFTCGCGARVRVCHKSGRQFEI